MVNTQSNGIFRLNLNHSLVPSPLSYSLFERLEHSISHRLRSSPSLLSNSPTDPVSLPSSSLCHLQSFVLPGRHWKWPSNAAAPATLPLPPFPPFHSFFLSGAIGDEYVLLFSREFSIDSYVNEEEARGMQFHPLPWIAILSVLQHLLPSLSSPSSIGIISLYTYLLLVAGSLIALNAISYKQNWINTFQVHFCSVLWCLKISRPKTLPSRSFTPSRSLPLTPFKYSLSFLKLWL